MTKRKVLLRGLGIVAVVLALGGLLAPSVVAQDKKAPLQVGVLEVGDINQVAVQKGFVTILKVTPTIEKNADLLVQANINVRNHADTPVDITYRAVLDGDHIHPLTFTTTVAPHAWDVSPVQVTCDGLRPGQHTVEVQAEVAGASAGSGAGTVTFASRSMLVVQFGPIFHPPG